MPPDPRPLESSPFGRGSGLRPLNFRTQVYPLCTQVQTGLGKTLACLLFHFGDQKQKMFWCEKNLKAQRVLAPFTIEHTHHTEFRERG